MTWLMMETLKIYQEELKILCNKALYIAKNLKYDGYQRGFASMIYKFFDRLQVVLLRGNIHAQVATLNNNMTFSGMWVVDFYQILIFTLKSEKHQKCFSNFNVKQFYHM